MRSLQSQSRLSHMFRSLNIKIAASASIVAVTLAFFVMYAGSFRRHLYSSNILVENNVENEFNVSAIMYLQQKELAILRQLRVEYGEMYCRQHKIGPRGGFCLNISSSDAQVGGNHYLDRPLCDKLSHLFSGKNILDLGCGLGQYGKCLKEKDDNISWSGYDGAEGIEKATGQTKFIRIGMILCLLLTFS